MTVTKGVALYLTLALAAAWGAVSTAAGPVVKIPEAKITAINWWFSATILCLMPKTPSVRSNRSGQAATFLLRPSPEKKPLNWHLLPDRLLEATG